MAYFMVLATLANFAGDILVSGLVKIVQVPGRCQFGAGVVIPQNATQFVSEPEYNQLAVRMAIEAQNTSLENGGLSGIYWKYNSDPNFRAEAQDVAGNWTCNNVHQDVTYPAAETTIEYDDGGFKSALQSIRQDLTKKGLLYSNSTSIVGTCVTIWGSAFFWGASTQTDESGPWDVRASIDTDMVDQCVKNKTLTLKSYHCSFNAPSLQWIINNTAAIQTIEQWTMGMYGAIMDDPYAPANETLSSFLDVLTMVSHGGRVQTDDPAWGDPTIGCLADMAAIPREGFFLLLIATMAGASMLAFWLILFLLLQHAISGLFITSLQLLKDRTPNDLVDWMRFALWRSETPDDEHETLRHWNLSLNSEYEPTFEVSQRRAKGLYEGNFVEKPIKFQETYVGF